MVVFNAMLRSLFFSYSGLNCCQATTRLLIETCQWPNYRHVIVKILAQLLACLLGFPVDLQHDVMWSSSNRALWFLIWARLLLLLRTCSRGHKWRFNNNDSSNSSYVHLRCAAKLPEVFDQDFDDEEGLIFTIRDGDQHTSTRGSTFADPTPESLSQAFCSLAYFYQQNLLCSSFFW